KQSLDQFVRFKVSTIVEAAQRIQAAIRAAGPIAKDDSASVENREAALRLLAGSSHDEDLKTLIEIATDGNGRLQKVALASLRKQKNPKLPEKLMAGWKNYMVGARPVLIDLLLAREEGIKKLLAAVESGLIATSEI